MNYLKSFFNYETYRKFSVYLKPSTYYLHPELKIKGIPSQRYKLLMTMRDLRLWIVENAPYSSRAETYQKEIFRLHNEITYLQYKGKIYNFNKSFFRPIICLPYFYFLVYILVPKKLPWRLV